MRKFLISPITINVLVDAWDEIGQNEYWYKIVTLLAPGRRFT